MVDIHWEGGISAHILDSSVDSGPMRIFYVNSYCWCNWLALVYFKSDASN